MTFQERLRNISLKRKLIAFALILSILPVAILGAYAYEQTASMQELASSAQQLATMAENCRQMWCTSNWNNN